MCSPARFLSLLPKLLRGIVFCEERPESATGCQLKNDPGAYNDKIGRDDRFVSDDWRISRSSICPPADKAKSHMVVVSRPYMLSFYVRDRKRVASVVTLLPPPRHLMLP